MILITGRGFLPQQIRVSWSQYALQVPPPHRNAVGYNPLAVLVIMYQKEVVILHSWVAATQVRRGVGAQGAHNLPCRAAHP